VKTSSTFVPVLFIVMLFIIVLPRVIRAQTGNEQILPATSIMPEVLAEPAVSERPVSASQAIEEALPPRLPDAPDAPAQGNFPDPGEFAAPYLNGDASEVIVVSVENRFTLPVVQQPHGQPAFVSSDHGVLTQFDLPGQYGTAGLLAHNFLSGKLFAEIIEGDLVTLVRGDGNTEHFQVTKIENYQALSPNSPYSEFVDLSEPGGQVLTSAALFNRVYTLPDQVVFQTCIAAYGEPSWGRLFITAARVSLSSDIPVPAAFISNN